MFLQHLTNLRIIPLPVLRRELASLFGGWEKWADILSSSLKGGPCGLLGLYNSLFANFIDNYNSSASDFEEKKELLMALATSLTQRITYEAAWVCNVTLPDIFNGDVFYIEEDSCR